MTKKLSVKFGTPPPRKEYDWAAIAADLRSRRGEWGLVAEGGRISVANAIRQGLKDLPLDEFEWRTANNDKKADPPTCDIWLRCKKKGEK